MLRSALVISEYAIVRAVVLASLGRMSAIGSVLEAPSRNRGIRLALEHQPDLTLVDEPLEGRLASALTPSLREVAPQTSVILLTLHTDEPYAGAAFDAGAAGYLRKDRLHTDLDAAIAAVLAGDRYAGSPFARPAA